MEREGLPSTIEVLEEGNKPLESDKIVGTWTFQTGEFQGKQYLINHRVIHDEPQKNMISIGVFPNLKVGYNFLEASERDREEPVEDWSKLHRYIVHDNLSSRGIWEQRGLQPEELAYFATAVMPNMEKIEDPRKNTEIPSAESEN